MFSGQDGTVRIWSVASRSHQFLQQTCVFVRPSTPSSSHDHDHADIVDDMPHLLRHVCWSPSGKRIAGAMDNMLNVWTVAGQFKSSFFNEIRVILVWERGIF